MHQRCNDANARGIGERFEYLCQTLNFNVGRQIEFRPGNLFRMGRRLIATDKFFIVVL